LEMPADMTTPRCCVSAAAMDPGSMPSQMRSHCTHAMAARDGHIFSWCRVPPSVPMRRGFSGAQTRSP
jgi:hypothetical protein